MVLTWSDLKFDTGKLSIHAAYSYSKYNNGKNVGVTKGKLSRIIPLDPVTLNMLKKWKELQIEHLIHLGHQCKSDNEQIIFNNTVNNYLKGNYPNEYLKDALVKADIKNITIHGLRHTHITHFREAGADPFGVRDRVGHVIKSDINERVYTHATEKVKQITLQDLLNYYKTYDVY
ncbi:tyrosine-type recombinase/integrase [Lysinibacillus fusiformis]|nr:tyrosine-type recombinase/integrase [Lysinibacillus fusiformis]MED4668979.1 tyrosine-type recombinase/integrase [Lysinibacillus fusiformis]